MKDRVRTLLRSASPDNEVAEPLIGQPAMSADQALQVLALAQRTAEEHVLAANRGAEKIRADANSAAAQITNDAQEHARSIRAHADRILSEVRIDTDRTIREARTQADEIRREAEQTLAAARKQAEGVVNAGREQANQLGVQARYRYEDVVGGLGAKREALQQQIESLEHFDQQYRSRLVTFMQAQLRALWVERSEVQGRPGAPASVPGGPMAGPEPNAPRPIDERTAMISAEDTLS